MAHHRAAHHPHTESKEVRDFKIHSADAGTPDPAHSAPAATNRDVKTVTAESRKSIFDYQVAGFPWPFLFAMSAIALAALMLIMKTLGVL